MNSLYIFRKDKLVQTNYLIDPCVRPEKTFQSDVIKVLKNYYPEYIIFPFSPYVRRGEESSRPDIALVHKNQSHWYLGEIETYGHDLFRHVIPQITCLKKGTISIGRERTLQKQLNITRKQAELLIKCIPREVVVISNFYDPKWKLHIEQCGCSFMCVYHYKKPGCSEEIFLPFGKLKNSLKSLCFGEVNAIDNLITFHTNLPQRSSLNVTTHVGTSKWLLSFEGNKTCLIKQKGIIEFRHKTVVQMFEDCSGNTLIKDPQIESGS